MSGEANALQVLVYQTLLANPAVSAIVAARVYDRPPAGAAAPYISFGPSDQVEDDADCLTGHVAALQIDCWSEAQDGMRECKALVTAVKKALHNLSGDLTTGALVSARVTLVRVMPDPDGITTHGVITLEAAVEEA